MEIETLDSYTPIIMAHPEVVLDALSEMWDYHGQVLTLLRDTPLGTSEGVAKAAALQGEAKALFKFVNEFLARLTEAKEGDTNASPE